MRRRPPHIVVTTPESLYVLLGSESGRQMLATTRSVIVDEIHALAPNKRGAHLSAFAGTPRGAVRGPIAAGRTVGHAESGRDRCPFPGRRGPHGAPAQQPKIIDSGHQRPRDLDVDVPDSPLEAVMSGEVWTQVYDRLARLIEAHEPRWFSSIRAEWRSGSRTNCRTGSPSAQ